MVTIINDTVSGYQGGEELANSIKELNDGLQDLETTIDSLQ